MAASETSVSGNPSEPAPFDPSTALTPTSTAKEDDDEFWTNYEQRWIRHLNHYLKVIHCLNYDAAKETWSNVNCRPAAKMALDGLTHAATELQHIFAAREPRASTTEFHFLTRSGAVGWAAMLGNSDGHVLTLFDDDSQSNWNISDFYDLVEPDEQIQQSIDAQVCVSLFISDLCDLRCVSNRSITNLSRRIRSSHVTECASQQSHSSALKRTNCRRGCRVTLSPYAFSIINSHKFVTMKTYFW